MKTITSILTGAFVVLSPLASQAITNTAIAVSGTNIVLSWPSYGYESYLVQYRETLAPTDSWSQVVNAYPANTNQTKYTLYGLVPAPALNGDGGSGNVGTVPSLSLLNSSRMTTTAAATTGPLVIPADGSGGGLPLALYPPGFDLSGFLILDPTTGETVNGAGYSVKAASPLTSAYDNSGSPLPLGGLVPNGGPIDPPATPTTGFFRVFHIPDWLADFSGYTFTGPTFIPVDYESPDAPVDYVDSTTVLINGQPFDATTFMPYVINGVTNWGMGIYFDEIPNGTATIQLLSTVRQTDTAGDDTTYMTFSNAPATITIENPITFTNWSALILSNTYTFNAQSTTPNVNWEIDIYDVNDNFVNSQTGYSSDGNISWTWDMTDYTGASRIDDSDPFFYPEITLTYSSMTTGQAKPMAGGSTTSSMPPVANQFPSQGDWLFTFMDNFYTDGTTMYPGADSAYKNAIGTMGGGPALWNIGFLDIPLKYGQVYSQSDRNASWSSLQSWLESWNNRNLYYFGHGAPGLVGGDYNVLDSSNYILGAQITTNSQALLRSQWVHDNVTYNKMWGAMPFRFVFLDGCNTAATNSTWPQAWGIPGQVEPLSYFQSSANTTGARPCAFVGWDTRVGGSQGWGTAQAFWLFRQYWMGNWSVEVTQGVTLRNAFDQALSGSNWVDQSHYNHMQVWGYQDMTFYGYNHSGDWPQ